MPWTTLQVFLRRIATPLRHLLSFYALLLALFTLLRLLRISGPPLIDLANTFAPYLYMPLVLSFPLSIIVTRGGAPLEQARKRLARPAQKPEREHPPRWSALLQIGLLAIGLYWFAAPAIYRPLDPPTGETFRVVSFNVQGGNAELERATEWLLAAEPDVIVLQETAEGYDPRLAPLYEVYAHEDHIEGSARVFSRFPILGREALVVEEPGQDEAGREALRLLLNLEGRPLAVYALHFSLPLRPRSALDAYVDFTPGELLRYDESRRNAQIRRFLSILERKQRPTSWPAIST